MKRVLITGGNGDIAQAIAQKLTELGGYEIRTPGRTEMDVTSVESVEAYVSQWVPDVLINNAGYVFPQSISDCDITKEKNSIDINLFGVFNCSAAVLKRNPAAHIVNIGSSAATKIHGTWSSYCATKAAVVMATQCWAEDGVSCVCVSPGRAATKMRRGLYPNEDQSTLMKTTDFAQVIAYAVQGKYPNGAHLNVNVNNVQSFIEEHR